MNFRKTVFWAMIAAGLFAFIYFFQRPGRKRVPPTPRVIAQFDPGAVTLVQVRPAGQLEIRAERTNGSWVLTAPLSYPAQALKVEKLLKALHQLSPATYLSASEIRAHPKADEEYGFNAPQASVILQEGEHRLHLLVGCKTAPGDQVFLQVVGNEGACIVDANFLNLIPQSVNDWRDTALLDVATADIDRVSVTNAQKAVELQRDISRLWRIAWPSQARADTPKVDSFMGTLENLRAVQFVSDDQKPDLELYGLQPCQFEIALAHGTNTLALLQFGKALTNDTRLLYARCSGKTGVFAVSGDLVDPWRQVSVNALRDRHLLAGKTAIASIDVRAEEKFSVVGQTNGTWKILPQDWPADSGLVEDLVGALGAMEIVQFVKDVVPPQDLPQYGLAAPSRSFILHAPGPASPAANTNDAVVQLDFGSMQDGKLFVRRADETSVYAVSSNEVFRLPSFSWQMRDRQVCRVSEEDVARVAIRQQGRARQIVRNKSHDWSLAAGSQGIINDLAIEETVRALCSVRAGSWVARNPADLAAFGFSDSGHQVTIEQKNGTTTTLEFGREAPSGWQYAKVLFGGEPWIFEFPWPVYRDVATYLSAPAIP